MPRSRAGRVTDGWAESENPWKASGAARVLQVDDLVSVTSIEIDTAMDGTYATDLSASDYELCPRNAALGPEPHPYNSIELLTSGSQWAFPNGVRVKVTGVWGWPSVPEALIRGCVEITRILLLESPRAFNTTSDFGIAGLTNADARNIVQDLVRDYGKVTI